MFYVKYSTQRNFVGFTIWTQEDRKSSQLDKPFDTLIVYLKEFWKQLILKKKQEKIT